MVLRGDAEADPAARLRHYVQAVAIAPPDSSIGTHARRKRWTTVLALPTAGPMTPALREELSRAATELEALGEHARAAEAFARLEDAEGRARSLARAGDVEALETFLAEELNRDRAAIAQRRANAEFDLFVASGQRRDAMAVALASTDEALRERARAIESRRVAHERVHLAFRGKDLVVSLGEEIVIGRAPEHEARAGTITVASTTLSRRHVRVARAGGEAIVQDLGSRNGTTLRGLPISDAVPIGAGVELRLGRDVSLVVRPTADLPGAVAIEVAGKRFIAPLGPAMLGFGRWRLERSPDRWVELWTEDQPPAFAGSLHLTTRITLLSGDAIGDERGGPPLLELKTA
jgi:hypothetical protein